jgi:hypothetical protein
MFLSLTAAAMAALAPVPAPAASGPHPALTGSASVQVVPMVGGYRVADASDPGVQAAARFAGASLGGTASRLVRIDSAYSQIVQGTNYRLDLTMSDGRRWRAVVHRPLRGEMRMGRPEALVAVAAQRPAVPMVGGFRNLATSDAGARAAVAFVIAEMEDEEAELDAVERAEVQIVQGANYRVQFTLADGSRWRATVHRPLRGAFRLTAMDLVEPN